MALCNLVTTTTQEPLDSGMKEALKSEMEAQVKGVIRKERALQLQLVQHEVRMGLTGSLPEKKSFSKAIERHRETSRQPGRCSSKSQLIWQSMWHELSQGKPRHSGQINGDGMRSGLKFEECSNEKLAVQGSSASLTGFNRRVLVDNVNGKSSADSVPGFQHTKGSHITEARDECNATSLDGSHQSRIPSRPATRAVTNAEHRRKTCRALAFHSRLDIRLCFLRTLLSATVMQFGTASASGVDSTKSVQQPWQADLVSYFVSLVGPPLPPMILVSGLLCLTRSTYKAYTGASIPKKPEYVDVMSTVLATSHWVLQLTTDESSLAASISWSLWASCWANYIIQLFLVLEQRKTFVWALIAGTLIISVIFTMFTTLLASAVGPKSDNSNDVVIDALPFIATVVSIALSSLMKRRGNRAAQVLPLHCGMRQGSPGIIPIHRPTGFHYAFERSCMDANPWQDERSRAVRVLL